MEPVVERILNLIEIHGEKAAPLMKKIGLSSNSVSDWKRGKANPSTDAIIKIADYFNVSTDYLLLGEESNTTKISLTPNELQFLQLYAKLDEFDQHECIGFIKGMLVQKSTK